jgi:NTP pyrophosphatase (non-canonical NTP hydrolase)
MDLEMLQARLRQFAAERDWEGFHTPKNLAMALMVEAAELAELFQWLTPEQSQATRSDLALQRKVGDELADVLLYLAQLADHTGVDLDRAVAAKLQKNASKHPPLRPGQRHAAAALPPRQTHVLLDYENVQPDDAALRALVPDVTDLWLFHGPHQTRVDKLFTSFGDRVTRVPISRVGKNSLDFHLSFYVGYIAATHPDARLVVLANDQGYAPMLEHAEALGFEATLVGHARTKRPAARTVVRKTAPAGRRKTGETPAAETLAAPVNRSVNRSVNRPVNRPAKAPVASSGTRARRAPATQPAGAAASAEQAAIANDAARAATRRTSNPAARKQAATPAAIPATKPAKTAARAPAKVAAKPAAKAAVPQPSARRPASALLKTSVKPAKPLAPAAPARRPAAALHKLTEQLRRLGDALPKKQAPLRRLLQSLLGPTADDAALQSALSGLVAAGLLAIDERGAVTYTLSSD